MAWKAPERQGPPFPRRYLGSKQALVPFIMETVRRECGEVSSVADLFAGTGAVGAAFAARGASVVSNDMLMCNTAGNEAWLSPEPADRALLREIAAELNAFPGDEENYLTENFAGTYLSFQACSKAGHAREEAERLFSAGEVNRRERAALVASIVSACDRAANTIGHYDAWRRGKAPDRELILRMPDLPEDNREENLCLCLDAAEAAGARETELAYLDPPYNSRQYCDAYHFVENIARWEKPPVSGVARKFDRSALKSGWCSKDAPALLRDLVSRVRSRWILLSYSNAGRGGCARSAARITDSEIMDALSERGEVSVFSEPYRQFTAGGKRPGHAERLFLCRVL